MSRIQPKPSTVKKLFALSGNKCAFPACKTSMVSNSGEVVGEICHIEAAEEGGERFNVSQSDEERRGFENLILLCANHHKETNNVDQYPVEKLKRMKTEHENNHVHHPNEVSEGVVSKALEKFMKQNNSNSGSGIQFNNQAENQSIGSQIGVQHNYYEKESNDINNGQFRHVDKQLKRVIDKIKKEASPPKEDVIDYENNLSSKRTTPIYEVPVSQLRFRKANGRIKSEVSSHETLHGHIDELSDSGQALLRDFLAKSDPDKKEILKQQIKHKGQLQPAVITCDGFLINGNRRKMIFEELYKESHLNPKYANLRVAILDEDVTEFEVQRIENRYQLQDEGKSEYHGLNRALTLRANIEKGYPLEAQIKDDPQYADKPEKEFDKAVAEFKREFLYPLERVDEYLKTFERPGLYNTISEGIGDKEGRWEAFKDYSKFYQSTLKNDRKLRELGIQKDEIGHIENAIFKIIRKRSLSGEVERHLGKLHMFVRGSNLKKYLSNETDAKKYFINIAKEVPEDIPNRDKFDKEGKRITERQIDEKWGNRFRNPILQNLMKAHKAVLNKGERDKPLELLEDALKKLHHNNLDIESMGVEHFEQALKLTRQISDRADYLYTEIDHCRGKFKKLGGKK